MRQILVVLASVAISPLAVAQKLDVLAQTVPGKVQGSVDVSLRWRIGRGFLQPGSLKVYRQPSGTKGKGVIVAVLPVPTDADVDSLLDSAKFRNQKLVSLARSIPDLVHPPIVVPPSKAVEFDRRAKDLTDQFRARRPFNPEPRVQTLSNPPRTVAAPQGNLAEAAFRSLTVAASVSASNAEKLALGTKDENQKLGDTLDYDVYFVDATGREGAAPIGSLNGFRVTAPSKPDAPGPLKLADMHDSGRVAIRWRRPDAREESDLLQSSYKLVRLGDNQKPTPLHSKPIIITDPSPTSESPVFFTDQVSVPGTVEYGLVLIDGFGRQSDMVRASVNVEDWRVPSIPSDGGALLGFNLRQRLKTPEQPPSTLDEFRVPKVTVGWLKANVAGGLSISYDIYRKDLDQVGAAPVKLTPRPVDGAVMSANSDLALAQAQEILYGSELDAIEAKIAAAQEAPAGPTRDKALKRAALDKAKIAARTKAVLTNGRVLTYQDTLIAKDHRYAYYVVSVCANGNQSSESAAFVVDVPTADPPPTPKISAPEVSLITNAAKVPRFAPSLKTKGVFDPKKLADPGAKVHLAWSKASSPGTKYTLFRRFENGPFIQFAVTEADDVDFDDVLLKSRARTVTYRVVPVSRWGIKGDAAETAKVSVPSTVAPDKPNILSVTAGETDGTIVVTVAKAAPDQGVTGYIVRRDGADLPVQAGTGNEDEVQLSVPVTDTVQHQFAVIAVATPATGLTLRSELSATLSGAAVRRTLPTPAGLQKANTSPGAVNLTWTGVNGATKYIVRRRTGSSTTVDFTVKVTGTTYVDTFVQAGASYNYEVVAVDDQGAKSDVPAKLTVTAS